MSCFRKLLWSDVLVYTSFLISREHIWKGLGLYALAINLHLNLIISGCKKWSLPQERNVIFTPLFHPPCQISLNWLLCLGSHPGGKLDLQPSIILSDSLDNRMHLQSLALVSSIWCNNLLEKVLTWAFSIILHTRSFSTLQIKIVLVIMMRTEPWSWESLVKIILFWSECWWKLKEPVDLVVHS